MKTLVRVLSCFLALCPVAVRAAYELPLAAGWSLISLPEQQINPDIAVVTRSLQSRLVSVWSYADGAWQAYFPGSGASSLTRMDAGRAYWVQLSAPATLVGAGLKPSGALALVAGWNFVGCNSATARSLALVFGAGTPGIESVQAFDNGAWRTFTPGATGNTLAQLDPGRGYWVRASRALNADFGLVLDTQMRALDATAAQGVTGVTATGVTLTLAVGGTLAVNNILSVPPIALAPRGLLRKITGVTRTATSVVLGTTDAKPGDVVVNGVLATSVALTSASAQALAAEMNRVLRAEKAAPESDEESVTADTIHVAADIGGVLELPALRFNLNRTVDFAAGSLALQGQLLIEPQVGVNIEFENRSIKSARFFMQGRQSLDFAAVRAIPSNLSGSFGVEFLKVPLGVAMVGPVPVKFELAMTAGISGEFSATSTTRLQQEATFLLGVNYERGIGFTPITNFQGDATLGTQTGVTSSVALTIGPQISADVGFVAGPFFGYSAGPSFEAETVGNASTWGVYWNAGFEGGLAVDGLFGSGVSWTPVKIPLLRRKLFPSGQGTIAGQTVDARGALSGVTVTASPSASAPADNITVGTPSITDAAGNYSLRLPVSSAYRLSFTKTGYITQVVSGAEVTANTTTSLPPVYLDSSNQPGTVRGIVTSATTGLPVANALLTLRPTVIRNNVELAGTVAVASTDSAGRYEARNLEPGYYTAQVTASSYIPGTLTALARAGAINEAQNGTLSPRIDDQEWRIVLTWGATPSDLDSHLTGPVGNSSSRFHVAYYSKGSRTASPFAFLDIDDITSFGPETITIARLIDGTYRYSVHDYSNGERTSSTALAGSGARVNVFRGNTQLRTYNVPSGGGTLWTVFEIRNGTVFDINTMSYVSDESTIQSTGPQPTIARAGAADDVQLIARESVRKKNAPADGALVP